MAVFCSVILFTSDFAACQQIEDRFSFSFAKHLKFFPFLLMARVARFFLAQNSKT
jgi:hypothetical protein